MIVNRKLQRRPSDNIQRDEKEVAIRQKNETYENSKRETVTIKCCIDVKKTHMWIKINTHETLTRG